MLTADDFRRIALGMSAIRADEAFGMVKLTPDQQEIFVRGNPGAFAPESGAWGRQGCTAVRLDAADEDAVGEAMTLAWQNSAATRARPTAKRYCRAGSAIDQALIQRPHDLIEEEAHGSGVCPVASRSGGSVPDAPRYGGPEARPVMAMPRTMDVGQLLAIIDQAYDHRSWHGTNLRGSIRVSPTWLRGGPLRRVTTSGNHGACGVLESMRWRRLTGAALGSFPLQGSNWFTRPDGHGSATRGDWMSRCSSARIEPCVRPLPICRRGNCAARRPGAP